MYVAATWAGCFAVLFQDKFPLFFIVLFSMFCGDEVTVSHQAYSLLAQSLELRVKGQN